MCCSRCAIPLATFRRSLSCHGLGLWYILVSVMLILCNKAVVLYSFVWSYDGKLLTPCRFFPSTIHFVTWEFRSCSVTSSIEQQVQVVDQLYAGSEAGEPLTLLGLPFLRTSCRDSERLSLRPLEPPRPPPPTISQQRKTSLLTPSSPFYAYFCEPHHSSQHRRSYPESCVSLLGAGLFYSRTQFYWYFVL